MPRALVLRKSQRTPRLRIGCVHGPVRSAGRAHTLTNVRNSSELSKLQVILHAGHVLVLQQALNAASLHAITFQLLARADTQSPSVLLPLLGTLRHSCAASVLYSEQC